MRKYDYYVGDFETTVYEGQETTAVWASALVKFYHEDVEIYGSIDETLDRFIELTKDRNICVYYHNLKFDGEFWISYFHQIGYTDCFVDKLNAFLDDKDMPNKSYKYVISDKGQWYKILIRIGEHYVEIRDSFKLLPFSVRVLGDSFKTKHKKLDMVYEGFRYPRCPRTKEEDRYIANDVLVVKEALEIMFDQGHKKLTIGSCCLAEYKATFLSKHDYENFFPNLYEVPILPQYGSPTAGDYVLKSYTGGWNFLVPGKARKNLHNGITVDVNALYPSSMHSDSGNYYPVGMPIFFKGDIPDKALNNFYFVRFRCEFFIKEGKLPFIHIRHSFLYKANENLISSGFYDKDTGEYYDKLTLRDGTVITSNVELTLSKPEYELFLAHYHVRHMEVLDGCYFLQEIGIFDEYLDKYRKIKEESEGAIRTSAKLFSNNLYGKLAMTTNSSFKTLYEGLEGELKFLTHEEHKKTPGYIPCGSAITAYSRRFTITAATKNFHGPDKPGFAYADTDSLHCDDYAEEDLIDIPIHPTHYNAWKVENKGKRWELGRFIRQKTYLEVVEGKVQITCAGMPDKCKEIFVRSLTGDLSGLDNDVNGILKYREYIERGNTIENFDIGLVTPGKLFTTHIRGGVLLKEGDYRII